MPARIRAARLPPGLSAAAARPARRAPRRPLRPAPLARPALALEVVLPLRVASEANARDGWRARHRRTAQAREAWLLTLAHFSACAVRAYPPVAVTFTRLGGRRLDDDNLAGALKALRDAVADWLGLDDGGPRVAWRYGQRPGGPAGVRVRVEELEAALAAEGV